MTPHPIPYQGSKRNLASKILQYFPDSVNTLIEPFAGSAAISLAATSSSRKIILSDINTALMSLWDSIINQPETLADYYDKLWHLQLGRERRFYDLVRERFNLTHRPYYFLYLLARCVKASIRYNSSGEFNQSPDNRRKGRNPKTMQKDILGASKLLQGKTQLFSVDYRQILALATPDDLVYLDPPYQGVSANRDPRYIQGINIHDFIDSLHDLNKRDIPYILSFDGRTGTKQYGQPLPDTLELIHIELDAGRSSQATLLGKTSHTIESLYLSPALCHRQSALLLKDWA
mgnify:CR=1 FL=1